MPVTRFRWYPIQVERLAARHSMGDAHPRRQHSGPSAHAKVMMWDMSALDLDAAPLPPPLISARGAPSKPQTWLGVASTFGGRQSQLWLCVQSGRLGHG